MTSKYWQRTPAKLTPQDVRDIRELHSRKVSIRSLMLKYGVSKDTIRDAIYADGAYRWVE